MKKTMMAVSAFLLCSCASGSDSMPVLTPLTTPPARVADMPDYKEITENSVLVNDFVSDVEAGYGLIDERSEQIIGYLIRSGFLWCDRLRLGMGVQDVESFVQDTFLDPISANLERATAVAAAINFCPDQLSKFES